MTESDDHLPSSIFSCDYPANGDAKHESVGVGEAPFAFETDHEALRGNADYTALLRTMAALQAQKKQVGRRTRPRLFSFVFFVKKCLICAGGQRSREAD